MTNIDPTPVPPFNIRQGRLHGLFKALWNRFSMIFDTRPSSELTFENSDPNCSGIFDIFQKVCVLLNPGNAECCKTLSKH